MAEVASIKIVSSIPFKGGSKLWSNRWHFNGGTPADATAWETLADNIVDIQKTCFNSWIKIEDAVGYAPSSDVPVFSKSYGSLACTASFSGDVQAAEVAALIRFPTAKRSSKNHPVYGFKYMHGVYCTSVSGVDFLDTDQKTALAAYAADWLAGISDGSNDKTFALHDGTAATDYLVETYVTHRDFRK